MLLKELFERYRNQLEQKYGLRLLPAQRRAIDDIINCRTPVLGEILSTCPHCGTDHIKIRTRVDFLVQVQPFQTL